MSQFVCLTFTISMYSAYSAGRTPSLFSFPSAVEHFYIGLVQSETASAFVTFQRIWAKLPLTADEMGLDREV